MQSHTPQLEIPRFRSANPEGNQRLTKSQLTLVNPTPLYRADR
jgi:hypothetical protein